MPEEPPLRSLPSHDTFITMSVQAPRVISRPPGRSNGVLDIPASATQKRPDVVSEALYSRDLSPRLKLVIRHLPPGLTQSDFEEALGEEWSIFGGKVDWTDYKPGKVSKESASLSYNLCSL